MSYLPLLYYGQDEEQRDNQAAFHQYSVPQGSHGPDGYNGDNVISSIDQYSASTGANFSANNGQGADKGASSSSASHNRPTDEYYNELTEELERLTAGVGLFPATSSLQDERQEESAARQTDDKHFTRSTNSSHYTQPKNAHNDFNERSYGFQSVSNDEPPKRNDGAQEIASVKKAPRRAPPAAPGSQKASPATQASQRQTSKKPVCRPASRKGGRDETGKSQFVDHYCHPGYFIRGGQGMSETKSAEPEQHQYSKPSNEATERRAKETEPNWARFEDGSQEHVKEQNHLSSTATWQTENRLVPSSTNSNDKGLAPANDSVRKGGNSSRHVRVRPPPQVKQLTTTAGSNQKKQDRTTKRATRRSRSVEASDNRRQNNRKRRSLSPRIQGRTAKEDVKDSNKNTGSADMLKKLLDATKAELQKYRQQLGDKTENARVNEERANALEKLVKNLTSNAQTEFTEKELQSINSKADEELQSTPESIEHTEDDSAAHASSYSASANTSTNVATERTHHRNVPSFEELTRTVENRESSPSIFHLSTGESHKRSTQSPTKPAKLLSETTTRKTEGYPISIQKEIKTFSRSNTKNQQEKERLQECYSEEHYSPAWKQIYQRVHSSVGAVQQESSSQANDIAKHTSDAMKYISRRDIQSKKEEKMYARDSMEIFRRVYGDVDCVYPAMASKEPEGSNSTGHGRSSGPERGSQKNGESNSGRSRRAPSNIPLEVHLDKTKQESVQRFPQAEEGKTHKPTLALTHQPRDLQSNKERFLEIAERHSPSSPASNRAMFSGKMGSSRNSGRVRRNRSVSPQRQNQDSRSTSRQQLAASSQDSPEVFNLLPEQEYRALCAMARSAWSSSKR